MNINVTQTGSRSSRRGSSSLKAVTADFLGLLNRVYSGGSDPAGGRALSTRKVLLTPYFPHPEGDQATRCP